MKLRFSIRDLQWLTLAVGLVVGWAVDHGRMADKVFQAELKAEGEAQKARISQQGFKLLKGLEEMGDEILKRLRENSSK